jgi:hypothetical protein
VERERYLPSRRANFSDFGFMEGMSLDEPCAGLTLSLLGSAGIESADLGEDEWFDVTVSLSGSSPGASDPILVFGAMLDPDRGHALD